jgi:hypothetical protein
VVVERVVLEHLGVEHDGDAPPDIIDKGERRDAPGRTPRIS